MTVSPAEEDIYEPVIKACKNYHWRLLHIRYVTGIVIGITIAGCFFVSGQGISLVKQCSEATEGWHCLLNKERDVCEWSYVTIAAGAVGLLYLMFLMCGPGIYQMLMIGAIFTLAGMGVVVKSKRDDVDPYVKMTTQYMMDEGKICSVNYTNDCWLNFNRQFCPGWMEYKMVACESHPSAGVVATASDTTIETMTNTCKKRFATFLHSQHAAELESVSFLIFLLVLCFFTLSTVLMVASILIKRDRQQLRKYDKTDSMLLQLVD